MPFVQMLLLDSGSALGCVLRLQGHGHSKGLLQGSSFPQEFGRRCGILVRVRQRKEAQYLIFSFNKVDPGPGRF